MKKRKKIERKIEFRWQNFRAFKNSGWIELKPLTIFIGPNASGKTSLLQPLIIFNQTIKSADSTLPLLTNSNYVDAGTFHDLIHNHLNNGKIHFSFKFTTKDMKLKKNNKIGNIPPCKVSLTFSQKQNSPQLISFIIEDYLGRLLIKRTLNKRGNYSIKFCKPFHQRTARDRRLYKTILEQKPRHFLFDDSIISDELALLISNKKAKSETAIRLIFSGACGLYLRTLGYIEMKLSRFLSSIRYIGPLRESPKRYYEFRGERPLEVGSRGEYTPSLLFRMKESKKQSELLNYWIKHFGLAKNITSKLIAKHALIDLQVKPIGRPFEVNIADTGFGLSQLLPLIVQTIIAKDGDLIITEQPEIHLNPKLETCLAEFFVSMIKEKRKFIIETHSEHFILRLRSLIKKGDISPEDVAIYFTEKIGNENKVFRIIIDKNGEFPNNDWPKGFFEEAMAESLRFATMKNK